ncbi:MAG: glycosyltransferase family 39 protein [Candidatus Omnitrophota bacterium]
MMQRLPLTFHKNAAFILVAAFFVLTNIIWWQQNKFVQGPDEGEHLYKSIELYENGGYLYEFLHPKVYHSYYNGPFFYLTAGVFYRLFQNTAYQVSMLNNIFYIILLLFGIAKLERLIFGTPGILSALFCMLIPMGAIYSRFFNPDIAVCSVLVWFMYFLKKGNEEVNLKYFYLAFLLILIGGYIKVIFYLYAFSPLFCYLILPLKRKQPRRFIFNLVLLAGLMLSFYFIYPTHFRTMLDDYLFFGEGFHNQDSVLQGFFLVKDGLSRYLGNLGKIALQIVNSQFGGIMSSFLVFSLAVFVFSNIKKEDRFILLACLLGPVLFISRYFIFFELRYFLPLLIIEAMIISYGLNFLFRKGKVFKFTAILFICFSLVQYLGVSFSKKWTDFFIRYAIFKGSINLSHEPVYVNPLPFPVNPLEEIIGVLEDAQKSGISPTVCFIYNFKKEPFTEFFSKRLGYYTHRFQRFFYTVCDGYLSCTADSVCDANFIVVSRSYIGEKASVLSPGALFYKKKCFSNAGACQPFLKEFEGYLNDGNFKLYRQVGAYDPAGGRKEQFLIYLRDNASS